VFAASGEVRYIAYETLFGRLDQFVVGMLLGRMWVGNDQTQNQVPKDTHSLNAWWLLPAAILVLAVLHVFSLNVGFAELKSPVWVVWPLIEGAVWGVFVWVYLKARWPGPMALKSNIDKALASLGAVSFSTYVFHNLVLAAYNNFAGTVHFTGLARFDTILTGLLVVLPLVLLMSALTYKLIEKPFLSMRKGYLSPGKQPHIR
jgi:peptidoglycan/LPS O-acetylase OafA/YrhL